MAIIKVKTGGITADAITDALIADDVVGTEHLTANEVDTAALGADAVTGAQLADNAVNSEHYTDGSVDTAHIADVNVTQGKIADQAINEAKMQISNAPTNGYMLTAQSGNTGGLTWAEASSGKLLQVVSSTNTYAAGYTSTSATDYLSASGTTWETAITPSATSSKILLIEKLTLYNANPDGNPSNQEKRWFLHLYRKIGSGSYSAIRSCNWMGQYNYDGAQQVDLDAIPFPESIYDTPNTTSAVTYKYMIGMHGSGRKVNSNGDGKTSVINLLEISG